MKVPATPPPKLTLGDAHIRIFQRPLWRIFRTAGSHALAWNELRHFGPVPGMRFDPQGPPTGDHPESGVMYAATLPWTAIAEVYQATRVIDRSAGGATIASWMPSRRLQLLDLTTNWPVLNGAAASMMMDDKSTTQAWAHAIDEQFSDRIDGLYHHSSINNRPMVTLFSRTERYPSFPARVGFRAQLSDPTADEIVAHAARLLGYGAL